MAGELSWARMAAAFVLLAATAAALVTVGAGLPPLPLVGGDGLAWLDEASAGEAAAAVLRLAALGLCGYLLFALAAAVVVELAPHLGSARRAGGVTPSFVRRVVARSARSGLTTGMVLGWLGSLATSSSPASAQQPPQPPSATTAADDPTSHTATMSKLDDADDGPPASATMVDLDDAPDPASPHPPGAGSSVPATPPGSPNAVPGSPVPAAEPGSPNRAPGSPLPAPSSASPNPAPSSSTPESVPPPISPAPGSASPGASSAPAATPGVDGETASPSPVGLSDWVVAPGESFWSIAEEVVTEARGGAVPDEQEVARYWRQLVAANHDRLVAPGNPDLLLSGQVLHVPTPQPH